MVKSLKGQFILSSLVSLLFIIYTFLNFNSLNNVSNFITNLFLFITLASVFNTGLLTQKILSPKNVTTEEENNSKSFLHR